MKYATSTIHIVVLLLIAGSSNAEDKPASAKYAIKAGKILTMSPAKEFASGKGVINNGTILLGDGKIEALGPASDIRVPEGYVLIDASDRWVTPGIV